MFNVRKRKILFQTAVAHTSQVQKARININNGSRMATCGFDGSVRIWDMNTMEVVNIIEDKASKKEKDNQINSLAWSPFNNIAQNS
jgi:WD40 repeat protein